ncbi:PQQ-binding-like beta-propeller repeat protein [bacterium]|nr:PQQ-binding-like beta-propeller repeat protein [bacterium]
MDRRLLQGLPAALVAIGLAAASADDSKKGKETATAEARRSPLEASPTRSASVAFEKPLAAGSFEEAFDAARALLEKHADELALVGEPGEKRAKLSLHLPVSAALRRRLGALTQEGRGAFAKKYAGEARAALAAVRDGGDPWKLASCGDRFFPLDEGGLALLLAGDAFAARKNVALARASFEDVLRFHPSAPTRIAAAKRLVALLPSLGSRSLGLDLASSLDESALEGAQALAAAARKAALATLERDVPDLSVDASGSVAPAATETPVLGEVRFSVTLPGIPKNLDWRASDKPPPNEWGQALPQVRRLLTGHAATRDLLLVHLGKTILAYDADTGEERWSLPGSRGLAEYMTQLLTAGVVLRHGIAVEGSLAYATVRSPLRVDEGFPRGRLLACELRTGKTLWDTDSFELEGEGEKKIETHVARLSFIGTPVVDGERVYCGAALDSRPHETFAVACDRDTGRLLWKRSLAVTEPYTAATQPWDRTLPRVTPAPAIAVAGATLLVASGNGCLGAIDKETGRFLWAREYERDDVPAPGGRFAARDRGDEALSRAAPPILVVGDAAFAMPPDSAHMLLVRTADGALLATHGRSAYTDLLGLIDGRLVLSGPEAVAGFVIGKGKEKPASFTCEWTGELGRSKQIGRGLIARRHVYIPTAKKGILRFSSPREDARAARETVYSWSEAKKEPGDLILGGCRLFSVGAKYAFGYEAE